MRRATGGAYKSKDGRWWARITYYSPEGKRHDEKRRATSKADAQDKVAARLREIREHGSVAARQRDKLTFADLADHYLKTRVRPAEIRGGKKVAGFRSHKDVARQIRVLCLRFGPMPLASINQRDVDAFQAEWMATPVRRGRRGEETERPRSVSDVNRHMSMLRSLFNEAIRLGWLDRAPRCVVRLRDETERDRVLSFAEETKLLAASCQVLRPILIGLLDTGCRWGEFSRIKWRDVDLDNGRIRIVAENSKTFRPRWVPITTRFLEELRRLLEGSGADELTLRDVRVCPLGYSAVKRHFAAAKAAAGIEDLRLHDLRHTAATRLTAGGLPQLALARVLGHTQASTSLRYVNWTQEITDRAAQILSEQVN